MLEGVLRLLYTQVPEKVYYGLCIVMMIYAARVLHKIASHRPLDIGRILLLTACIALPIQGDKCYILTIVIGIISLYLCKTRIEINTTRGIILNSLVYVTLVPLIFTIAQEYLYCSLDNRNGAILSGEGSLLTYMCYAVILSLGYLIIGNRLVSYVVYSIPILLLFLANLNVYNYRGVSLRLSDIRAGASTIGLLGKYQIEVSASFILVLSIALMILIILVNTQCNIIYNTWYKSNIYKRIAPLAMFYISLVIIAPYSNQGVLTKLQINPLIFSEDNYGLAINILSDIVYSQLDEPKGYRDFLINASRPEQYLNNQTHTYKPGEPIDNIHGILPKSGLNYETSLSFLNEIEDRPDHIVVIMRESLADLSHLNSYKLSEDNIPFMRSLSSRDNTITGYLCTPMTGGGTANTEFEVLTGGLVTLFQDGSYPYQSHINRSIPSLISLAKSNGYETNSIHTYKSAGYNRENVYRYLGFDNSFWDEDFEDPATINTYIRDKVGYQLIEDKIQQNQPSFTFYVTMQSHGPWEDWPTNDELYKSPEYKHIYATDDGIENEKLSILASAQYLADKDLEDFIDKVESMEEKVLVVTFGDHQSCHMNSRSMEANWTPLAVYANYDIPEARGLIMSSNYIPLLVSKLSNMTTTKHIDLMEQANNIAPVISRKGIINSNQEFIRSDQIENFGYSRIRDMLESNTYAMLVGDYKELYRLE